MKKTKFDKNVQILTYKPNTCLNSGEPLGIPSCSLSMVTQTGYSRAELKHVENTLLSQAYRSIMCRGLLVFAVVTPTNTKTVYKPFNKFA